MKKILLLATLTLLFISCANNTSMINTNTSIATPQSIKPIAIPFREHGYSYLPSQVIVSQKAFDAFLNKIKRSNGFNKKRELLAALQNANIDFTKNNLLFYRITEPSGSIQLHINNDTIVLNNHNLTINIEESKPTMGTADMAYYALAYEVDKNIESITFDNKKQKVIVENKESDMIVPKNCQAWFDGCNHCSRIKQNSQGVCTQMACFAYNPQNFKCTSWKK
jgi:uncharacterized protein YcfL